MDVLEQLKKMALPIVEQLAKQLIAEQSDLVVDLILEKIKELIPGHFEDGLIEGFKPQIKALVKEQLTAQAEKIS